MNKIRSIDTAKLTKYYGKQLGWDVDLEVSAGRFFGYLGPNGAGNHHYPYAAGLIRRQAGRRLVFGLDIRQSSVDIPTAGLVI